MTLILHSINKANSREDFNQKYKIFSHTEKSKPVKFEIFNANPRFALFGFATNLQNSRNFFRDKQEASIII